MYDRARRRRAQRKGRERGRSLYIPEDELKQVFPDGIPEQVYYRTWADRRGGVLVRFYREP
jgi:hypothetical protein